MGDLEVKGVCWRWRAQTMSINLPWPGGWALWFSLAHWVGAGGGCLWNSPRVLLMRQATASVPAHDVFINIYFTDLRPGTALWKQSKCGNIAPTSWFFLFLLVLVSFRYSFDLVHVFAKNCYKSSGKEGMEGREEGRKREVVQSCPTLCDPMDCSIPGSSIHEIFQAIVLEWVAIAFSRGSSWLRDWTWSPTLQTDALPSETSGKPFRRQSNQSYGAVLSIDYHPDIVILRDG